MSQSRGARRHGGDGRQTRDEILSYAVQLASRDGLEGLTIGRLAEALHLSKSGLFAHFGSKEGLQLAVLERAAEIFGQRVLHVGRAFDGGLQRLIGFLEAWLAYVEARDFQGGCFFASASAEFDGRPGPVRDGLVRLAGSWIAALEGEARKAVAHGDLSADVDVAQLVFELHALVQESNWAVQLFGDARALGRARAAVRARLAQAATSDGRERVMRIGTSIVADVRAARRAGVRSVQTHAAANMN
jgi:AcrR family transcriptional regulator